jgi:transposase
MTVLDQEGQVQKTARLPNLRRYVEPFLEPLGRDFMAVIEAGRSSYVMAELLRELGGKVKMANPVQVKAIAHARIKTDKRDARTLADLLRADLIPEVYQRGEWNREAQRVIRLRAFWISLQTQVKNKIRVLLAQQREEVRLEVERREGGLFSRRGQELLKGLELKGKDREVLRLLLSGYQKFEEYVKESAGLVRDLYGELPEAQLIDTVPGFAETLSVLVAVEIADIRRFPRVEALQAYAGLIPSTHSSGDKSYHGRIIKQGNTWLRWALVEAVYPAIKKDLGLAFFYQRLVRRKGPNVAKVATARRLLTIIYRMLTQRRPYLPCYSHQSAA